MASAATTAAFAAAVATTSTTAPLTCGALDRVLLGHGPREHAHAREWDSSPASRLFPSPSLRRSTRATHLVTVPGAAQETTRGNEGRGNEEVSRQRCTQEQSQASHSSVLPPPPSLDCFSDSAQLGRWVWIALALTKWEEEQGGRGRMGRCSLDCTQRPSGPPTAPPGFGTLYLLPPPLVGPAKRIF